MSVVIGWDIGGAHLKAARVKHGRVEAVVQAATPLWLGLDSLEAAFDALSARARPRRPSRDHHDWANSATPFLREERASPVWLRSRPVISLLQLQASTPAAAGFVELGEAASHAVDIASANWHASAALLALKLPDALFIDIGSTTTDIIPIVASQVAAVGYTDAERLAAGELIYTGMTRSFVMSLASRAPFRGAWTPLMNEYFASSADVHRILGDLPDGADKMATADGREKTVEASRARLARMIGREADEGSDLEWTGLAAWFAEAQMRQITDAASLRLSRNDVVACGAGGCGGRRGRPRGRSGAPSATALSRIFFAHRGPRGSLALRACGRGRVAGKRFRRVRSRCRSIKGGVRRQSTMRLTSVVLFMSAGVHLASAAEVAAGSAAANDYPTSARAEYVFACMKTNGDTREALDQCSCSIDVIASLLPYDAYVTAATVASMNQEAGQIGSMFRGARSRATPRPIATRAGGRRSALFLTALSRGVSATPSAQRRAGVKRPGSLEVNLTSAN